MIVIVRKLWISPYIIHSLAPAWQDLLQRQQAASLCCSAASSSGINSISSLLSSRSWMNGRLSLILPVCLPSDAPAVISDTNRVSVFLRLRLQPFSQNKDKQESFKYLPLGK